MSVSRGAVWVRSAPVAGWFAGSSVPTGGPVYDYNKGPS